MADDLQRHDDVQRDHLFGADEGFQQQYQRVETSDHRPEDVGTIQAVLTPSTLRS